METKIIKNEKEILSELINKKLTYRQIAEKLGFKNHHSINQKVKKYGLKSQYFLNNKKKFFNQDFFETIDTESKAYWLGFIAADGCINIRKENINYKRIYLHLAGKDYDHLIKFKESISLNVLPTKRIQKQNNTNTCSYMLHSKKMFDDLIDKGITPRKSLTLEPPKNVPEDLIRHWIRGYNDGDGCIGLTTRDRKIYFKILGTYNVLKFISDFCKLNLEPWKRGNIYRLKSSNSKAERFLTLIYQDSIIYLERKYLIYKFNVLDGLKENGD